LDKHRKLIRLQNFDYSSSGAYFVTICTKNRKPFFGEIIGNKMILNRIGDAACDYWQETPKHFSNIDTDEFIVMPNHIHGIVIIEPQHADVGTPYMVSLRKNRFGNNVKGSLSSIVQQYKSAITRWCGKNGFHTFKWQSRFYDHVIRTETDLKAIREYIVNNPMNWKADEYHG